jgi:hypothetical protein
VSLANGLDFQIGTTDSVDTDAFDSVVLDFVWDSGADDVSADEALLKIIVQDLSGNTASDVSQVFEVEGGDHGSAPTDSLFKPRPPEVDVFEGTEQPPAGNRGSENFQNCLESEGNEETPCETSEEITEYLDALVNSLVTDADLSEKEKAKAEFIKRYLALQNNGQTLEEKLRLFDHGMTRGETVEMLVFLLTSHGVILQNGDLALKYSDVSAESPYAQAIAYATAYGIVEGYPDGSFRPEQSPNLAEVARMVVRSGALIRNSIQNVYSQEGLKAAGSDWFKPYIETLRHYGLTLPRDYEGLGVSVSGLRVLDILYDLLLAVGVNGFVNNS